MRSINLAIVGATGLVGEAIIKLLADRQFLVGELFVLASENGAGGKVSFGGKSLTVKKAEDFDSLVEFLQEKGCEVKKAGKFKIFKDRTPVRAKDLWFNTRGHLISENNFRFTQFSLALVDCLELQT